MTDHIIAARMMLDQMMADPDGPETIRLAHQEIREKRWGADYIDALGQQPMGSWPMEQLAVFARLHAMVYSGGHRNRHRVDASAAPGRL